jgi:hypothetical protein
VLHRVLTEIVDEANTNLTNKIGNNLINAASKQIAYIQENHIHSIQTDKRFNSPIVQWGRAKNSFTIDYKYTKFKDDYEEYTERYASYTAQSITDKFRHKLIEKCQPILDKNPNIIGIYVMNVSYNNGIDVELFFKWHDKQFTVVSQLVHVMGQTKDFTRYPTTFHNVILSNDRHLNKPSQEKMIEFFK